MWRLQYWHSNMRSNFAGGPCCCCCCCCPGEEAETSSVKESCLEDVFDMSCISAGQWQEKGRKEKGVQLIC